MKNLYNTRKGLLFALISTAIMVIYAQFVLGYFSKCFTLANQPNALGLQFSYSASQALQFFTLRTETQINCYKTFISIWDSIFPVLYTLMYILWLKYFFKNKWIIFLLPILHMGLDWSENTMEIIMANQYLNGNEIQQNTASIGSILTSLKWITSLGTYLLLILGIIRKVKTLKLHKIIENN